MQKKRLSKYNKEDHLNYMERRKPLELDELEEELIKREEKKKLRREFKKNYPEIKQVKV